MFQNLLGKCIRGNCIFVVGKVFVQTSIIAIFGKDYLTMFQQVVQLRKACSHPYLFDGVEPEPFEEGEHLIQVIFSL
jgi:SNF2 family DNA or RNA helicase